MGIFQSLIAPDVHPESNTITTNSSSDFFRPWNLQQQELFDKTHRNNQKDETSFLQSKTHLNDLELKLLKIYFDKMVAAMSSHSSSSATPTSATTTTTSTTKATTTLNQLKKSNSYHLLTDSIDKVFLIHRLSSQQEDIQQDKWIPILDQVFAAIDTKQDSQIDFEEYAMAISRTSKRATLDEKIKFSYFLFANEKDQCIYKDELKEFVKNLNELTNKSFTNQIEKKIELLFSNSTNSTLSYQQYKQSCQTKHGIEIADKAFGVYELFFDPILKPIEQLLSSSNKYEASGVLFKMEEEEKWRKYYFVLTGGILRQYKLRDLDMDYNDTINKTVTSEQLMQVAPMRLIPLIGCVLSEETSELLCFRIHILSENYYIKCRANTEEEYHQWFNTILLYTLEETNNRYNAYAPIRHATNANWIVNGQMCYERMADVLESAKEEIFITCWFISPEVFLRRNRDKPNIHDRFDYILKRRAEEGVMIYMILWNETKIAQPGLNSAHVGKIFESLHENIKVMYHPPVLPFAWAHHQKLMVIDQNIAFHGGLDVCWGRWDDVKHRMSDPCHFCLTWPGKDYFNPTLKGTSDVDLPHVDHIDREKYPRMPWHDIHMEIDGYAARDVSKAFIERWNMNRLDVINAEVNLANRISLQKKYPILALKTSTPQLCNYNCYKERGITLCDTDNVYTCSVQMLRSMTQWSGASRTEASIYNAYIDLINKAEHYIFIENQYFVSNTAGKGVQNLMVEAILNRIRWAIKHNKTFRVYILLPGHPDGRYGKSCSVRYIMYWAYQTLSRGGTSMMETFAKEFPHLNVYDYIYPMALRTFDFIGTIPVTEQVYVHGKIMIVDDTWCIIGSANINDRSFLGYRDSEFASIIEDSCKVKSIMDGKPFEASRFAFTLRMYLFNEFMGYDMNDVKCIDPVSDDTFYTFQKVAQKNTLIYQQVFPYHPSDLITTKEKVVDKPLELTIVDAKSVEKLKEIQGLVVPFPLKLLSEDDSLEPHYNEPESAYIRTEVYQ